MFSVALMAAMTLGAGTDYAIFLIGRYHEGRRHGVAPTQALIDAYRAVAPVVIGSALTVSVALACLGFAEVGMFRSAGLPCAIGILRDDGGRVDTDAGADEPRGGTRRDCSNHDRRRRPDAGAASEPR